MANEHSFCMDSSGMAMRDFLPVLAASGVAVWEMTFDGGDFGRKRFRAGEGLGGLLGCGDGTFVSPATFEEFSSHYFHPADREPFSRILRECFEKEEPRAVEVRLWNPADKTWRWVNAACSPARPAGNEPLRLIGVMRDIGDRVAAKRELEEYKRFDAPSAAVVRADGTLEERLRAIIKRHVSRIAQQYDFGIGEMLGDLDRSFLPPTEAEERDLGVYLDRSLDFIAAQMGWYKQVVDHTPLSVQVVSLDLRWIYLNNISLGKFGFKSLSSVVGESCFGNSETCGTPNCPHNVVMAGKSEFISRESNGSVHQGRVAFFHDSSGKRIGHIEVVQDITALHEEEERRRVMLDATPLACGIWNDSFELIDCNKAAPELFGLPDMTAYMEREKTLYPDRQPDGRPSVPAMRECLTETFARGFFRCEWLFRHADGTPMPADVVFVRVRLRGKDHVASYVQDLREIKAKERELQIARDAAEESARAKSLFLANMSHEIRTPMNAIIGLSELALREPLQDEVREYVSGIKQAGGSLLSIITDVLDFSKIESGRMELVQGPYLLSSLVSDVIAIIRTKTLEKSLTFLVDVDSRLPNRLVGDEVRLRQILLNLLSNAFKYTQNGSVVFSVSGNSNADGTTDLVFRIADTGRGIREEDMPRLFGDFVQFDKAANKGIEGTGLGLSISRSLAALMGGSLEAESEYGKGSVFTVRLTQRRESGEPLAQVENGARKPAQKSVLVCEPDKLTADYLARALDNLGVRARAVPEPEEVPAALKEENFDCVFAASSVADRLHLPDGGPRLAVMAGAGETVTRRDAVVLGLPLHTLALANFFNDEPAFAARPNDPGIHFTAPSARVLLVDDIATNIVVARGLIAPYGVCTDAAASGAEALELVARHRYDIIFMDHMMPGMDGMEATRRIRELPDSQGRDLVIVALTANAVSGMREGFLSAGFDDYLSKPISLHKLNAVMDKWIPESKKCAVPSSEPSPAPPEPASETVIPGLDFARGLKKFSGNEKVYREVLQAFLTHTPPLLAGLRENAKHLEDAEQMRGYAISIHGVKGSCSGICADAAARLAEALEEAAKAGRAGEIRSGHGEFDSAMRTLLDGVGAYLSGTSAAPGRRERRAKPDPELLSEALNAVRMFDFTALESVVTRLEQFDYDSGGDLPGELRRSVEQLDYDAVAALLTDFH